MKEDKLYKNKMGMFDFIKGVAIFAVIYTHTIELWNGEPGFGPLITLNGMLGTCWMPAFLLSSAYWYKPKPVKSYTKNQLKDFIFPFMALMVVTWGCYCVIHYTKWRNFHDSLKGVRSLMLGTLLGNMTEFFAGDLRICNVGPMWFVITLCFSSIIFNWIMNQDKIKNKLAAILPLVLIGILCGKLAAQPYCFSAVLVAVLCLYVGYRLKETKFLIRKWTGKEYILVWGIAAVGFFTALMIAFRGYYCNAIYLSFCLPMGILALRIGLKIGQGKDNAVTLFFKKLGRYTFWILMAHTVEVLSVDWHWFKEWHVLAGLPSFINFLAVLMIRFAVVAFGCFVIAKVKKIWTEVKENVISKRVVGMEK